MRKKTTSLTPLFSRRAALFFLAGCLVALAATMATSLACDDDDDDDVGAGVTGDIGRECSLVCFDDWCKNDDHPKCHSYWCVGRPDQTYCSVNCEVDGQCPAGFVCTEECGSGVAKNPVCVRENQLSGEHGFPLR